MLSCIIQLNSTPYTKLIIQISLAISEHSHPATVEHFATIVNYCANNVGNDDNSSLPGFTKIIDVNGNLMGIPIQTKYSHITSRYVI